MEKKKLEVEIICNLRSLDFYGKKKSAFVQLMRSERSMVQSRSQFQNANMELPEIMDSFHLGTIFALNICSIWR